MKFPEDLRYSTDHEWVRLDGGTARIGVTDYAQDALGDVVYVELPDTGRAVAAGETFAEVESTKSVSDIFAPVAGTVSAVNDALGDEPEKINEDPYGDGWICEIDGVDAGSLDDLMDAAAYRARVED